MLTYRIVSINCNAVAKFNTPVCLKTDVFRPHSNFKRFAYAAKMFWHWAYTHCICLGTKNSLMSTRMCHPKYVFNAHFTAFLDRCPNMYPISFSYICLKQNGSTEYERTLTIFTLASLQYIWFFFYISNETDTNFITTLGDIYYIYISKFLIFLTFIFIVQFNIKFVCSTQRNI